MSIYTIEELQEQLTTTPDPTKRADILCSLAEKIFRERPRAALGYAADALVLSEQTGNKYQAGMSYYCLATAEAALGNTDKILEYALQAKAIFEEIGEPTMAHRCDARIALVYGQLERVHESIEILCKCRDYFHSIGDVVNEAYMLLILGNKYNSIQQFAIGQQNLLASLEISRQLDDKLGVAMCYQQLSGIYIVQNFDLEKGIEYTKRALEISVELNDKRGEMVALTRLGRLLARAQQSEEAFVCLHRAEELSKECGYYEEEVYRGFVVVFSHLHQWEESLEYGLKALAIALKQNDVAFTKMLYSDIGCAYTNLNKFPLALEYLTKSIELASADKDEDSITLYNCYYNLADVYGAMGDMAKAFQYCKESMKYKDLISNQEKQRTVSEMQAKFDVESAEREKELFRVKNVELSAALDEVRRLNDNLTKLNTEKNEVLGIVAHDLKSPLSGVRIVASLLKEHYKRMPEVELETQLETIVDSTERMLSISSNLLKAQHIESGNAYGDAMRVDVSAVVGGLVESYRATAASKGIIIAFECEQSVELVCSEEALRQSVENLLSNAVKFTVHNGRVQVRVKKRTAKRVVVEVQDEGPGISKSDKRKLYGKYARLSARPTGGESTTGLGLWIAKRAVESLRGTIRCITGEGGTTFRIEVPLADS